MILNFWCLHACKETLHFCVHVLNSLDHTDNKSEFKKKKIGVDVDPQFKEMEAEQESLGGLHQEGHPATKYAKTN